MSKRVVAGVVAGLAGLLGAAVLVVPGVATGQGGARSQLSPTELGSGKQLIARLSGASEVPPTTSTASGVANISIDTVTNQICWSINVGGFVPTDPLDTPTAAHIHQGAVGANGPVVVPLFPPLPLPNSSGCTTDATYAPLIAANPAGFYVNVHNGHFPLGAIRGQLANAQQSTVLLPIPLRAYDSRTADGPLAAGTTRTIGLATGKDANGTSLLAVPTGASAAIVTLTITQTQGAGFVKLYSAAISEPATSSINWSSPDQILSVSTPTAVDNEARVKITAGVNATQVILDVVGYII
jgi:CHRD domain